MECDAASTLTLILTGEEETERQNQMQQPTYQRPMNQSSYRSMCDGLFLQVFV